MRSRLITIGLLSLALTLGPRAVTLIGAVVGVKTVTLPACELHEKLFPRTTRMPKGETVVDQWAELYHGNVRKIADEYLKQVAAGGTCDETVRTEATETLDKIAGGLGLENVHQEDMAWVLLQYLAAYECSLQAESFVVEPQVEEVLRTQKKDSNEEETIDAPDWFRDIQHERRRIREEAQVSRRALHRFLLSVSGFGRFQPLSNALQCLVGATVDIRNNLDLAAEASACLPKAWDPNTSLRTLNDAP